MSFRGAGHCGPPVPSSPSGHPGAWETGTERPWPGPGHHSDMSSSLAGSGVLEQDPRPFCSHGVHSPTYLTHAWDSTSRASPLWNVKTFSRFPTNMQVTLPGMILNHSWGHNSMRQVLCFLAHCRHTVGTYQMCVEMNGFVNNGDLARRCPWLHATPSQWQG